MTDTVVKENLVSPLINKKVKIIPVIGYSTETIPDADDATMLPGTQRSEVLPTNQFGELINPLTVNERKWLEQELGIDLRTTTAEGIKFWKSKKAKLFFTKMTNKTEDAALILDLNDPYQFILYKIALVCPEIAKSWADRNEDPSYKYAIQDEGAILQEELDSYTASDAVLEWLFKHRNNRKKLYDLIRLYGTDTTVHIKKDSSLELMYSELRKIADNKKKVINLYNLINLPEGEMVSRVLVEDGITNGILIKDAGNTYKLQGGSIIGHSLEEAAKTLEQSEYQHIRIQIEATQKEKAKSK